MNRETETQGWDFVRKVVEDPHTQAYLSADRLHRELSRLKVRLDQVRSRGGPYGQVDVSFDVHELLARLEAGSLLSTQVH